MDIRGFDDCEWGVGVFCGVSRQSRVSRLSRACLAPVSRLSRACLAGIAQGVSRVSRLSRRCFARFRG